MKKIFLCGHTGSMNRGCEAIVRSTVKVLGGRSGDITLMTFSPWQDRSMAREIGINLQSYGKYPSIIHRYVCGGIRKVIKKSVIGQEIIQAPLFSRIDKETLCLNIGGDTYCYGRPIPSIALNRYTQRNGVDNILWCCSIEKDNIKGEILEDLHKYKYIFARENLTYDALMNSGIPEEKVIKCCDPAFFLDSKEVNLPDGFVIGNTVGINVSEMIINSENPHVYNNIIAMIHYILNETDMSVCLIPHVYSIKENKNDYPILSKIYEEINSCRVSIVDKEYNCEQLKYIISKCRFFVGARTHSTIAAYSTEVPTLVIGYSVKSKGIATDLFGGYDGYVVPYMEMSERLELLESFKKIIDNELKIKQRLHDYLPEYKRLLSDAVTKYLMTDEKNEKPFNICDYEICTGCSACANVCPKNAIQMKSNLEGFLYPEIDFTLCVNCGRCRDICPTANKPVDNMELPASYAAINNDLDSRMKSSSGGVFTALAEKVISFGGVVFGAGFDDSMNVVHKWCNNAENLEELRGSKYVQSDIGDSYIKVEELLIDGKMVLFVGTPCQIGGLYAFLGRQYDNLLTIDFICHGVPSPMVWKKYIENKVESEKAKVVGASFRAKKGVWKPYFMNILFDNNNEYSKPANEDEYSRGFILNLYLRPSCAKCSFKQTHRQSDITLADFWGIEKTDSRLNDGKGTSLVMVHSSKGEKILSALKGYIEYEKYDFDFAIKENPSYYRSVEHSMFRKSFFKEIDKKSVEYLVNKYYGVGLVSRVRRMMYKSFFIRK